MWEVLCNYCENDQESVLQNSEIFMHFIISISIIASTDTGNTWAVYVKGHVKACKTNFKNRYDFVLT